MKPLDVYNKEREEQIEIARENAHLAYVLCPKCNYGMHYENPYLVNTGNPLTKWVRCPNCNYRGLKIV